MGRRTEGLDSEKARIALLEETFTPIEVFFRCQIDAEKFETWGDAVAHSDETGHGSFKAIERKENEAV